MEGNVTQAAQLSLVAWPHVPSLQRGLASLLHQLDVSQWWPAERLLEHQFRQLQLVVEFSYRTLPFYRERFESVGLLD
jgi:hypothetical protein